MIYPTVSEEGKKCLDTAIRLAHASRKQWVKDLLPREELVALAFAYPIALYEEMGHVHIPEKAGFYYSGKAKTFIISVHLTFIRTRECTVYSYKNINILTQERVTFAWTIQRCRHQGTQHFGRCCRSRSLRTCPNFQ